MSARLMSNHDVNALATFAADHDLGGVSAETAADAALALWIENLRSLEATYGDRAGESSRDAETLGSEFEYWPVRLNSPDAVIELAEAYGYQCDASPNWSQSASQSLQQQIIHRAGIVGGSAS